MPIEADYHQRISTYQSTELLALWEEIKLGETPDWDPGKAFEYLILRAFEIEGSTVTYPFIVQLEGTIVEQIDGAIYTDGLSCLVECKDQDSKIAIDPVAKLRNQLLRRPSGIVGVVFSRSSFTEPMLVLAQYSASQPILLWDQFDLDYTLSHQHMRIGLAKKYRYCVERGLPHYSLSVGDLA
jgi:hypothetical protein